ncbi:Uncharacterised protein [Metamycoplasma cloacale]|uniref:Gamma-glutamylcyclotransferase n=1 Tax=Metamycoplasma cloacale TaxID=92401 RepID=A0A2Z4LML2_9BACT|nr:gamma-glutamylcyclotransferase family protein [Metamycoplasma cloacale]AWX42668.1 gamma-glutamylcyclotransferase [Metamycoplasma cloacale]VEU79520.1 Uncharacterised protein [Metamycoplasma cloacale]
MNEEKIYVFSYGTIQDPKFYEPLLGKNVIKHPAVLNGFMKCYDQTNYFLLKKDKYSQVKGTIFEVTVDQLFMLDRWEMFPQYGRFQANVLITDKNEIIENVYVYSKLEAGEWKKVDETMKFSNNPNENDQNMKSFIELEERTKEFPLYDFLFLYKSTKELNENVKTWTHPYVAIMFEGKKDNQLVKYVVHGTIIELTLHNQHFLGFLMFSKKDINSGLDYQALFNNEAKLENFTIKYIPLVQNLNLNYFTENLPWYYLSNKLDKELPQAKLGVANNALELALPVFHIDPWYRLNQMLNAYVRNYENNEGK